MALSPQHYHPELSDSRLRVVAESLLEVMYETEMELTSDLDDGYTRGTATFGRQRNAIIGLCQNGKYGWLKLTNAAMDVTFEIGGVPCRFFADDPSAPRKPGFFRRNDSDQLFDYEAQAPTLFRFIVAKPQLTEDESDVYFVGFDANLTEVFRWQYSRSTPALASMDDARAEEVKLPPATAKTRPNDADQAELPIVEEVSRQG